MKVLKLKNALIKSWTDHVPVEPEAVQQLINIATMPFIYKHLAVMPDVHLGKGATVGSVIATKGAIIPAAVGVDIGCGMIALETSLTADQLPDSLAELRAEIEASVPHGFVSNDAAKQRKGCFVNLARDNEIAWDRLQTTYEDIIRKHPKIDDRKVVPWLQLGTLGGGNHFIEICLDERNRVWIMLHSGSRGIGNAIGSYFIEKAKEEMRRYFINLPDRDLAYLVEGSALFDDYCLAVKWAQDYAAANRQSMLNAVLRTMRKHLPPFSTSIQAVNCHHNYVAWEHHFGSNVIVTRKGAVRAREGDMGIIPGSMGAKSFIVRGKGNPESFHSCSHGAGRVMSRSAAREQITLDEHVQATAGIECRKDEGVIDESPRAYKNIDDVMRSQEDLVEIVHTLRQVLCVKG